MLADPRYAFRLKGGDDPTSANTNAAAGDLPLEVAAEHWLSAASGGLLGSDAPGFHLVQGGWRLFEVALAQVVFVETGQLLPLGGTAK